MIIFSNFSIYCLPGESEKGCRSIKAKNMDSGADVFITVWEFGPNHFRWKCPISCKKIAKPTKCAGHGDGDATQIVLEEFRQRADYLISHAKHIHLIPYIDINFSMVNETLIIHLVQEYVEGESIRDLVNQGKMSNVSSIAKNILQIMTFFRDMDNPIQHGYLNEKSIFLDKSADCRISDFDLIPYLMYLKGNHTMHQISDLKALGLLIKAQNELIMQSTNDFIRKCCSNKVLSFNDLLGHSFLSNDWYSGANTIYGCRSLQDFDNPKLLGSGTYGCVIQSRHMTDEQIYALKLVKVPTESKGDMERMEREVKLMMMLNKETNHKNVIKYITSWRQQINVNDFRRTVFHEQNTK